MSEIFCEDKTVYMDDYLNVSQYYIYPGEFGRITSEYVERNGQIVETPGVGKEMNIFDGMFYLIKQT